METKYNTKSGFICKDTIRTETITVDDILDAWEDMKEPSPIFKMVIVPHGFKKKMEELGIKYNYEIIEDEALIEDVYFINTEEVIK
jgi:hypothetical protein